MRRTTAKHLALLIGILVAAFAFLFAAARNDLYLPGMVRAEPLQPSRGAAVYQRLGCAACHAIGGTGNRRNPLDGVGSRLTTTDLRRWIVAPGEMKPGVRKPAYDRTPTADVDALVEYLAGLKATTP